MGCIQKIGLVIAVFAVIGCNDNDDNDKKNPPPVSEALEQKVSPAEMQGLWRSDGYMTLLEITDERILEYEVSSVHCLLVDDTALADYLKDTPHILTNSLRKRFATDQDLDRRKFHAYFYDRIEQRPAACVTGITAETSDPAANFNVFWNVFNEQYEFFDLRNIHWQQQYDENIAAAEKAADEAELFDILASMIEAFNNDSHISLEAGDDAEASAGSASDLILRTIEKFEETYTEEELQVAFNYQTEYDDFDDYLDFRFAEFYFERIEESANIIAGYMVDGELKSAANEQITWGVIEGNVGYLGIASMLEFIDMDEAFDAVDAGTLDEADLVDQLFTALNEALDQVMADLSTTGAVIIDIRTNGGGEDVLGLEIAGRFFDQRRLVFRKKARDGDGYSEEVEIYQEPTVDKPYTKPIYLLTSGETGSAAETFAIAMRALPYVTLVGETTEGILSDPLESTLPNGWELKISNEIYATADGEVFESSGIPPSITALFLDPDYEANQQDAALEAALQDL